MPRKPLFVIVSGAPGSGKTTLAQLLARELGLPLLTKDDVKEAIADVIEAHDRDESRRIGFAAYRVVYTVAHRLLDAGAGFVLESNFERGRAEERLAPLVAKSRAVLVQCEVPEAIALERYRARAASGVRHPVHKDEVVIEAWSRGIRSDHSALELGIPVPVPKLSASDAPHDRASQDADEGDRPRRIERIFCSTIATS